MEDTIVELIPVLVWPVTVVAMTLLLRSELKSVLCRLDRATLPGGTELDFGELRQQAGQFVRWVPQEIIGGVAVEVLADVANFDPVPA